MQYLKKAPGILGSLFLYLLFFTMTGFADMKQELEARIFESDTGGSLSYRLLAHAVPESGTKIPLLVFMHGAGERGDDNSAQLKHGISDIVDYLKQHDQPLLLLAPQVPRENKWVDYPWDKSGFSMPENPSETMALMFELFDRLLTEYPVDADRIYICGLSMGGYGTWDLLMRKPDFAAAAIPICGGGDPAHIDRISHIPIWVFHGARDNVVPPARSREMVKALRGAGGKPGYTEYPDTGHDSWSPTFSDEKVLQWLFEQRK